MSNEVVSADTGGSPSDLRNVLSEAVLIAELVIFWGILAAIPTAYLFLDGPTGTFRGVTLAILGGVIVLGLSNILLYVIARGISLGNQNRF